MQVNLIEKMYRNDADDVICDFILKKVFQKLKISISGYFSNQLDKNILKTFNQDEKN